MDAQDNLVIIERAPTSALAERLQSLLAAERISAFLDPYTAEEVVSGELYREFTGVDVKVRPEDATRARTILDDAHRAGRILKDLYDGKESRERESNA
jgi:hypothetical protein